MLSMVRSSSTVLRGRLRTFTGLAGGIAAVVAGLCWTVKAVAILVTGQQPALLFELAPSLMAVAVLFLGQQLPPGNRRILCVGMATGALLLGVAVLTDAVIALPTVAYSIAIAGANLLILACLVTVGLSVSRRLGSHLPLVLGLVTVPAILFGGLAAEIMGERALELPLVALGAAWMVLGVQLSRGRYTSR